TASNITIAASGSNVLTLDNSPGTNAILDVGQAGTNSGIDLISAPVGVASGTPLQATITGGTLQLTNTGTMPNVIGTTSTFKVNSGGTLRESAVGTGSLVTGNLTDIGALGSGAITLAGGTLIIDPTASTASNGLASRFINLGATNNTLSTVDFSAAATGPGVQTASFSAATGLDNTFSFGSNNPGGSQAFYSGGATTNFAAPWTGMINITTPGPTTFTSTSDDAMKVYIDNVLVLNNDGGHGIGSSASGTINLAAGLHDIRVDYTQGGGGDMAQLSYTPASGAAQPIPFSNPQPIPFSALYTPDPLNLGNAVTVSGSPTIHLTGTNFTAVGLGALTVDSTAGAVNLTVSAEGGQKLNFTGTTLVSNNAFTLTDSADVALSTTGSVALAGITVNKKGTGQLF